MRTRTLTAAAATVALVGSLTMGASAAPQAAVAAPQKVSGTAALAPVAAKKPSENAKLNKVKTPHLRWFNCYRGAKCAKVKVPLDYDKPKGATTNLAVLRVPATGRRLGTLFVNPGGPGGSATQMAMQADTVLSPEVRKHFDVIGVDPRGIGYSDNVECLPVEQQDDVYGPLEVGVPWTYGREVRFLSSMRKVARACSKNPLATSMSTAEVARDMEMVRRGLGEGKLNYIGFSYGSHLGTTYANMFPANIRTVVIDGTLNPQAWSGTRTNQSQPLDFRLNSGVGAWTAMEKIFEECKAAGSSRCELAATGDPKTQFDALAARLKKKAITIDVAPGETFTVDYSGFVSNLLGMLYASSAPDMAADYIAGLVELSETYGSRVPQDIPAADRRLAKKVVAASKDVKGVPGREFLYNNSLDSFLSVTCTDSRETTRISQYRDLAKQADKEAPHFGRAWLYSSAGCAGDAFTGEDEDAYVGPYNKRTRRSVLIVGNYWDPATSYTGAQETRKILGLSRLVSSDSWGHTAYGVSECVTKRVDTYLIEGRSPVRDVTCPREWEAFPETPEADTQTPAVAAAQEKLPDAPAGQSFPEPKVVR